MVILDLTKLPGAEHSHALRIQDSLYRLGFYCRSIEAVIALFQMCDTHDESTNDRKDKQYLGHWKIMALHHGAITINNFYEQLLSIDDNLQLAPTIKGSIDINQRRSIKKLFESYFPFCADVRHSVAHLGEFYSTPEDLGKHGAGAINSMRESSYETTVNGKQVSYDLSAETLKKLETVKDRICALFVPMCGQHIQNAPGQFD
jgi:hypothetical protein